MNHSHGRHTHYISKRLTLRAYLLNTWKKMVQYCVKLDTIATDGHGDSEHFDNCCSCTHTYKAVHYHSQNKICCIKEREIYTIRTQNDSHVWIRELSGGRQIWWLTNTFLPSFSESISFFFFEKTLETLHVYQKEAHNSTDLKYPFLQPETPQKVKVAGLYRAKIHNPSKKKTVQIKKHIYVFFR